MYVGEEEGNSYFPAWEMALQISFGVFKGRKQVSPAVPRGQQGLTAPKSRLTREQRGHPNSELIWGPRAQ